MIGKARLRIGAFLMALADVLFPARCSSCGRPAPYASNLLCRECRDAIGPLGDHCDRCSGVETADGCGFCGNRRFYPIRHIAAVEYDGPVEKALHGLKFSGRRRLHLPLAELLLASITKAACEVDVVTAVPMNRAKKWKRGYNQSELIARHMARELGRPFVPLLKENPRSRTQRKLHIRERFLNVLGRYRAINRAAALGKRVLLVDDVLTTGATINECARMLTEGGAAGVISATVARAGIKKLEIL
ncbi:MAG TPA: ComF family protein [Spirochaetota bacterium]|nr:MAG: DNA utilization protein GntX [Spirochaetes bacterium ADurb.BinA120]HPI14166.1 ComF family protein [Spirochaetota bacterium]HPV97980.1 ComF family protein [Spirochaetota bacterium]